MYRYVKSNIDENKDSFSSYLASLSGIYDEFLEEHILNSEIYSIYVSDVYCGYFGIFNKTLLTQFFITKGFLRHGQKIFVDIIKSYRIKNAFVPTCDELFLTLALDNHLKVNLQAYFFQESGETVKPAKYSREYLKIATLEDIEEIKEITGDFIDKHEDRINEGQLYILRDDGEFLGLGIIVDNRLIKGCACTGMFTNEKCRKNGIGRSIIMNLMDICREKGLMPLAGCWYYNHNSKRTLESSGYVSTTRLLRIDFTEDSGEV